MKLFVPQITITPNEGFTPEKDIFKRKPYGERLLNLISNSSDELVLALDAPWGAGKSTFIKMWQGLLHQNDIPNIYFDAFENDYQQDAFLALTSQIYSLIDQTSSAKQKNFKSKAVAALKTVSRAGIRVGVKAITAGLLDGSELDETGNVKDASKETSELVDKYVSHQLDKAKQDRENLCQFKQSLSELCEELCSENKVVFIIDELDRCRPDFALSLLESIKHLFSVPQLTFVLVMNSKQLEEAVKCKYGAGVDANRYLQKFISLWTTLPTKTDRTGSVRVQYLNTCLDNMGFNDNTRAAQVSMELYAELIEYFNMSLREIEKSLTNFAIVMNLRSDGLNDPYMHMLIFLSIAKCLYPDVYDRLANRTITYDEVIEEMKLENLKEEYLEEMPEKHIIKWLIKYQLTDENTSIAMLKQNDYYGLRGRTFREAITNITSWLETFKV